MRVQRGLPRLDLAQGHTPRHQVHPSTRTMPATSPGRRACTTSGTCVRRSPRGRRGLRYQDTATCNGHHCADCVLGDWRPGASAPRPATAALRPALGPTRTAARRRGGPHTDDDTEEDDCNEQFCPIDCLMGDWTEYSDAARPAAVARWRARESVHLNAHGKACPGAISLTRSRATRTCPLTAWSATGRRGCCTKSCAGGTQTRTAGAGGSHRWTGLPLHFADEQCSTEDRPVDCVMGHRGTCPDVSWVLVPEAHPSVSQPVRRCCCGVNSRRPPRDLGPCPSTAVGDQARSDCTLTCGGAARPGPVRSRSIPHTVATSAP